MYALILFLIRNRSISNTLSDSFILNIAWYFQELFWWCIKYLCQQTRIPQLSSFFTSWKPNENMLGIQTKETSWFLWFICPQSNDLLTFFTTCSPELDSISILPGLLKTAFVLFIGEYSVRDNYQTVLLMFVDFPFTHIATWCYGSVTSQLLWRQYWHLEPVISVH